MTESDLAGGDGFIPATDPRFRDTPPLRQAKLPGLDPGRQHRAVHVPERAVEEVVDQGAALLHWTCLSTVNRYRMTCCPRCGHRHRPQGGYGASPGVPDRLIIPPWLPRRLLGASHRARGRRERGMATPTLEQLRAAYERDESLTAGYATEARAYVAALEAEVARLREALGLALTDAGHTPSCGCPICEVYDATAPPQEDSHA